MFASRQNAQEPPTKPISREGKCNYLINSHLFIRGARLSLVNFLTRAFRLAGFAREGAPLIDNLPG